jgi:hypothetical protein
MISGFRIARAEDWAGPPLPRGFERTEPEHGHAEAYRLRLGPFGDVLVFRKALALPGGEGDASVWHGWWMPRRPTRTDAPEAWLIAGPNLTAGHAAAEAVSWLMDRWLEIETLLDPPHEPALRVSRPVAAVLGGAMALVCAAVAALLGRFL